MQVIIAENYEELSHIAANRVIEQVKEKPQCVICFPTGNTPKRMYELLVEKENQELVDFSKAVFFNLDEYIGLSKENPISFAFYMQENLYSKLNKKPQSFIFDTTIDPKKSCHDYELLLREFSPIDLVILGIGRNGHIGFNEPGSSKESRCRVIELTQETQRINNGPQNAMTMGIANILESKKIIQLISGESKKEIAQKTIEGEISSSNPSSFLQTHKNVEIILDKEAASLLKLNYEE